MLNTHRIGWSPARIGAVLLGLVAGAPAFAAPVLDQSFDIVPAPFGPTPFDPPAAIPVDWAQTFTVGVAGTLERVEFRVSNNYGLPEPLVVEIRTTAGGAPTEANAGANVLGSVSVPSADTLATGGAFFAVDFSSFAIPVAVGDVLAIVWRSTAPDGTYELDAGAEYAGGSAFLRWAGTAGVWGSSGLTGLNDIVFRTYVEPGGTNGNGAVAIPEPAGAALLGLAVAALLARTRRRRA